MSEVVWIEWPQPVALPRTFGALANPYDVNQRGMPMMGGVG